MSTTERKISREDLYFQLCDLTGEPINQGYYIEHLGIYIDDTKQGKKHLLKIAKESGENYKNLKEAYKDDFYFWTAWGSDYQEEDISDLTVYLEDGEELKGIEKTKYFISEKTGEKILLID